MDIQQRTYNTPSRHNEAPSSNSWRSTRLTYTSYLHTLHTHPSYTLHRLPPKVSSPPRLLKGPTCVDAYARNSALGMGMRSLAPMPPMAPWATPWPRGDATCPLAEDDTAAAASPLLQSASLRDCSFEGDTEGGRVRDAMAASAGDKSAPCKAAAYDAPYAPYIPPWVEYAAPGAMPRGEAKGGGGEECLGGLGADAAACAARILDSKSTTVGPLGAEGIAPAPTPWAPCCGLGADALTACGAAVYVYTSFEGWGGGDDAWGGDASEGMAWGAPWRGREGRMVG